MSRHKGATTGFHDCPGGGAQGTNFGILNFLTYVNSCGVPFSKMLDCLEHEHREKYIGQPCEENQEIPDETLGWTKICHPVLPEPDPHISSNEARFKYIDDNVAAEAVSISRLVPITRNMESPLNYRVRTLHELPKDSCLQTKLKEMDEFCKVQQMKLNISKTKTAVFNSATSRDFYPRMVNSEGTIYDNVEEFSLLGVDFVSHPKSGVKWDNYLQKCIRKVYSNIWILKHLAQMGVSSDDLLLTYTSRIRVHLEQNVALWHFSISQICWLISTLDSI